MKEKKYVEIDEAMALHRISVGFERNPEVSMKEV